MSEALNQITIPEFDEDDYNAPSFSFGRAANAFGLGSSGPDSPTLITPTAGSSTATEKSNGAERDYFHARNDSATSEDSAFSFHAASTSFTARSNPLAHSSQTSLPSSVPFTKKSSFASLRNAFKSGGGKTVETPPVPILDRQAYPALRNPFSRSTSSLTHTRTPSSARSPPSSNTPRPSTPSSNDHRHGRAPSMRAKGHAYGRSQHSYTGSVFHASDGGSDHHGSGLSHTVTRQSTPPPVPRVPNEFGNSVLTLPFSIESDDKIVMDPRTPSEFALHAIFMRFAEHAEEKIDKFLRESLERDPLLTTFFGPGVDSELDDILTSLGHLAVKSSKPVIDSIMRWRKTQLENVSGNVVSYHSSLPSSYARARGVKEIVDILNVRKSLAGIYIMCRALIAVIQTIPRDALGDSMGFNLEETTFEQLRRPDMKLMSSSANHRINAELYAALLGKLSNIRFLSVTDRFLSELAPIASNQIPKDTDVKYEYLVKALRHVEIKVWPPESFEEGAEFIESLAKCFENAHGYRLKLTFAETLVRLLHPIGKTAQAEVNHPLWAKAIEIIYPKARDMTNKPRYWQVAYPLVVTSLCVAPQEYFLRNWVTCLESGLSKLKERPYRTTVMNGVLRLIWTYLYRCRENISSTTTRLESVLKHFFPPSRLGVNPSDEHLEPLIYMVHYILTRHLDFGSDLVMNLLQEQQIKSASNDQSLPIAPERMTIALEAILRSLYLLEKDEIVPSWPSNSDFNILPERDDYPSVSTYCHPTMMSKPGIEEFYNRCGATVALIASACARSVGRMSIFDDRWSLSRLQGSYEDTVGLFVRQHEEGTVAYPTTYSGQITILQSCFSSWPRCLHPSLPLEEALDSLIPAVIHVEPLVGEAASGALQRITEDPANLPLVLSKFTTYLFSPKHITSETTGTRSPFESHRLLNTWYSIVEAWVQNMFSEDRADTRSDHVPAYSRFLDVESGALFLLSSRSRTTRAIAARLLRLLDSVISHYVGDPSTPLDDLSQNSLYVLNTLLDKNVERTYLDGLDDLLDAKDQARLEIWRQSTADNVPLRIAESDDERDRRIWWFVYPAIIRSRAGQNSSIILSCRDMWIAAATRYHSAVVLISGVGNRANTTQNGRVPPPVAVREREKLINDNMPLLEQWHFWVKLTCCTANPQDGKSHLQHNRAPSDALPDRDLVSTNTRGLFRYLAPFLNSEHSEFREIAVLCISAFPSDAYRDLLDDLSTFSARCIYNETTTRVIMSPNSASRTSRKQDRLYLAVAHIHHLTSHYLKEQRGVGRQDSLTHVLKFVRHTQKFLSEADVRSEWQQQRLRRYFCGIVERLFDGLASLQSSDRFIPANMHLTLYRLCEEWCQCGNQSERVKQRLVHMQIGATAGFVDPQQKAAAIAHFLTETKLLSHAAAGAMASLCQKAFFPPPLDLSGSPGDRLSPDLQVPLEVGPTLDRLVAMLANMHDPVKACGRKALRSLVDHKGGEESFLDEVLKRSFVTSTDPETSSYRFFQVVADAICAADSQLTFGHVVCLGISNLCSQLVDTRRLALAALDSVHMKAGGKRSLFCFEAGVSSSAASVYLDAQLQVSGHLVQEHPNKAVDVIVQCASKFPMIFDVYPSYAFSHILNGLAIWFSALNLLVEDKTSLTKDGRIVLFHLLSLTLRFSESYPDQVHALWSRLVDENLPNGHATIRFLLEQSAKVGSSSFISCARKVVACLTRTSFARQTIEELCGVIEPVRMLPSIEHKLEFPDVEDTNFWSDLDALFAEQPRHVLGAGQFALLFLGEVAVPRAWEYKKQLPVLLQGIFTHIGHRNPYVRNHARKMLFQLLRAWLPGYDELADHTGLLSHEAIKDAIQNLERDMDAIFWTEDDSVSQIGDKMTDICCFVLRWLEPIHQTLADEWGSLALLWGTTCSIRPIAFRSLQIFRSLMPKVSQADLAQLLGRLSNTVAAQESNLHSFTVELMLTLESVARSETLDTALLPQLYWATVSCLSTPVEPEFTQLLNLLECLLDRLDLNDPYTTEGLLANKPGHFSGTYTGLQPLLLVGLRSIRTYQQSFRLLQRLSKVTDPSLIDSSGNRVRDMYTLVLPWCLRCMEENAMDESVAEYANDTAMLAEEEDRPSISRIMTSFVKSRFRTKDDFMRQAAAALREHYAPDHWTDVVSLFMSFVLNQERWLRIRSMQFLKVLFQLRETRNPVDKLGSELLMPLLRLLNTDLAPDALQVLEEPMTISGGLAAKHVLRMSMHLSRSPQQEVDAVTEVFGMPEESGWSVARPNYLQEICRANVMAVFDTCKVPTRPSRIDFEPEIDRFADPLEADLGDLVQNLHELSTFFLGDPDADGDSVEFGSHNPASPLHLPEMDADVSTDTLQNNAHQHLAEQGAGVPRQQLEARVAAILAKSTDSSAMASDSPHTPFLDVFHVNTASNGTSRPNYDHFNDDSDSSEYDMDTFEFETSGGMTNDENKPSQNGYFDRKRRG